MSASAEKLISALYLSRCLTATAPPPAPPKALDWNWIAQAARRYGVGGRAHAVLHRSGWADTLPEAARSDLREAARATAAQTSFALADAASLAVAAQATGARPVFLKGTVLAAKYYQAVQERHLDDVDIEVTDAQVEPLLSALQGAGFVASARVAHDGTLIDPWRRSTWKPWEPLPTWHGRAGTPVDLHVVREERPRAAVEEIELQHATLRVPSAESLLLDLSVHVMRHHDAAAHFLPRHLSDVAVVASHVRPDRLAELERHRAVADSLHWIARLAEGEAEAKAAALRLFEPSVRTLLCHASQSRIRRSREVLQLMATTPSQAVHAVLPHPRYMRAMYGVSSGAGSHRLALCYAERLLRLLVPGLPLDKPCSATTAPSMTSA